MNQAKAIAKYLQSWAEVETSVLSPPQNRYRCVLALAAYREDGSLLERIDTLMAHYRGVLIILVINRPTLASETRAPADVAPNCAETMLARRIERRYPGLARDRYGQYFDLGRGNTLLAIDRYSRGRGIPVQQGVGLARKIAADIACLFIHRGLVTSPWIHSSDADVRWPGNYFAVSEQTPPGASALLSPFRHGSPPGDAGLAVQLYELSLRYYVAGLRWAGSPYAMHTVGSTLAIHYINYAMVRGFPRRSAGEDFYILNKLAKTGPVRALPEACLGIAGRSSDRVPFGTGPACDKILGLANPIEDYCFYHPRCFEELRKALESMGRLVQSEQPLAQWQNQLERRPRAAFVAVLEDLGMGRALVHAHQQSRDPVRFARHLATWFDAFRTRKFVHAIRDRYQPSLSLDELLTQAHFLSPLLGSRVPPVGGRFTQPRLILTRFNRRLLDEEIRLARAAGDFCNESQAG